MPRINWSDPSLSGGLFEKIVGCLLGIEHPESVRVRPSRGDGGVDVFIPVGNDEVDVYQAKYFRSRLRWDKIEQSLERLSTGRWLGRRVRHWYLTVPVQPSTENLASLDQLSAGQRFPARWFGEDRLTALAARHPEVGDYYLGDGRVQLTRLIEDWENCLSRIRSGSAPRVDDVSLRLNEIVDALGRTDPHLKYGLEVHPVSHIPSSTVRPGVLVSTSRIVGDNVVTCLAYPRYRGAELDAASRIAAQLHLTDDAGQRLSEVLNVGGDPIELGAADILDLRLPSVGHQISTDEVVRARIVPVVDRTPAYFRLAVASADGQRVIERLTRVSFVPGSSGATSTWITNGGCVEMKSVANSSTQRVAFSIRCVGDFEGPLVSVVDDIRLLRAFGPGATFTVAAEHGPVDASTQTAIEHSLIEPAFVTMLDALRVIQDHTATVITIPSEFTRRDLTDVVELAALLEGLPTTGDMRTQTTTVTLAKSGLGPGGPQDLFGDHFALGMLTSAGKRLVLPHQSVELPSELLFVRLFRTAQVASIADCDDESLVEVTLKPGRIPIWIDQRIDEPDQFTDELQMALCQHDTPIDMDHLAAKISALGTQPTI